MAKELLRPHYKQLRRQLGPAQKKTFDKAIFKRFMTITSWQSIKSLHIYQSRKYEADTESLIKHLFKQHPRIKISHPTSHKPELEGGEQFDVVVVPVVAFDEQGYRLGQGGGYYDKFLVTQPQALKIGLAYQNAFVPTGLPHESHDIRLNLIVTEQRLYQVL